MGCIPKVHRLAISSLGGGWYPVIEDVASRWPVDKAKVLEFRYLPLTMDILLALAILAFTTFTTESYLRRQAKWHQFSLQFILAVTTFVALLLANIKYDIIRWRGDSGWEFIPFFFIAMGLWCVFWTGLRLIGSGVGRIGVGSKEG